ncbi:hypothetical protein HPB47_002281 [Ixodes persulcatus]|uniref:Uncharacterized protein n=1 Tax=Ixodes persulcatus TaxID=34615 RepID=A0AC60PML8_IXOPE|nr:hypothetical protein HPB47_002281 [Ixodes persulcatus]
MKFLFRIYDRLLRTHPAKTQILTTATVMLSSDLMTQKLVERRDSIDVQRAVRFFLVGLAYSGPTQRAWLILMDKRLVRSTGPVATVKKLVLDQLAFAPVSVFGFLGVLGVLQGRNMADIERSIREKYSTMMKTFYKLWPVAQIINFRYVPLPYRLLYANCVSLVWNTYTSWKANRFDPQEL